MYSLSLTETEEAEEPMDTSLGKHDTKIIWFMRRLKNWPE